MEGSQSRANCLYREHWLFTPPRADSRLARYRRCHHPDARFITTLFENARDWSEPLCPRKANGFGIQVDAASGCCPLDENVLRASYLEG